MLYWMVYSIMYRMILFILTVTYVVSGKMGTDTIGAYPYWAYVYDAMSEKKISKEEAEKQAKEYFTAEYGITNYDYTEWFDVFSDTNFKDDNDDEVCDSVGFRAGKPVYGYDGWVGL